MDLGYALIERVLSYPVVESLEPLVSIPQAARAAGVELRFATSKIAGDLPRIFALRQGLIEPLLDAARAMRRRGWLLVIEDGYRTRGMQQQLGCKPEVFESIVRRCIWETGEPRPPLELLFRRAAVMIANYPRVGTHMSASAVDISVLRLDDGTEVSRGYPYLEVSEHTPMRSPFVSPAHLENRLAITAIMEAAGWVHFPYEFWHFNQGDGMGNYLAGNGRPGRYGPIDWNPLTGAITPYADPDALLNPPSVIAAELERALERIAAT